VIAKIVNNALSAWRDLRQYAAYDVPLLDRVRPS
jgi:hypothetical protein